MDKKSTYMERRRKIENTSIIPCRQSKPSQLTSNSVTDNVCDSNKA